MQEREHERQDNEAYKVKNENEHNDFFSSALCLSLHPLDAVINWLCADPAPLSRLLAQKTHSYLSLKSFAQTLTTGTWIMPIETGNVFAQLKQFRY